jgi:hypothetical protein
MNQGVSDGSPSVGCCAEHPPLLNTQTAGTCHASSPRQVKYPQAMPLPDQPCRRNLHPRRIADSSAARSALRLGVAPRRAQGRSRPQPPMALSLQ